MWSATASGARSEGRLSRSRPIALILARLHGGRALWRQAQRRDEPVLAAGGQAGGAQNGRAPRLRSSNGAAIRRLPVHVDVLSAEHRDIRDVRLMPEQRAVSDAPGSGHVARR
jgi:hypothetical protein